MGSIPILTETPPLSSSVGRALQHKAHLVKYCEGGAKVAHLAHYQKTTFESFARNHIAGSSKGRTLDSLPSNLGSTPSRAPMSFRVFFSIIKHSALTWIL